VCSVVVVSLSRWESKLAAWGLGERQLELKRPRGYWKSSPESHCPVSNCSDCGSTRFKIVETEPTVFFWRCRSCSANVAIDVTE